MNELALFLRVVNLPQIWCTFKNVNWPNPSHLSHSVYDVSRASFSAFLAVSQSVNEAEHGTIDVDRTSLGVPHGSATCITASSIVVVVPSNNFKSSQ